MLLIKVPFVRASHIVGVLYLYYCLEHTGADNQIQSDNLK